MAEFTPTEFCLFRAITTSDSLGIFVTFQYEWRGEWRTIVTCPFGVLKALIKYLENLVPGCDERFHAAITEATAAVELNMQSPQDAGRRPRGIHTFDEMERQYKDGTR